MVSMTQKQADGRTALGKAGTLSGGNQPKALPQVHSETILAGHLRNIEKVSVPKAI